MELLRRLRLTFCSPPVLCGLLFAALYLANPHAAGLKMDGMTNAVFAKNVLARGNWQVFHYTDAVYPEHYSHPPLMIWVAALFFRTLGVSDFTARLPGALFTALLLLGLWRWAKRRGGTSDAFLACCLLLLNPTYTKYSTDFFLEVPLACFLIWSLYLFEKSGTENALERRFLLLLCGFCWGLAFLTKSVFVVYGPLTVFLWLVWHRQWRELPVVVLTTGVGALLPIALWVVGLGGAAFLLGHWADIRERAGTRTWSTLLHPLHTIILYFVPWNALWAKSIPATLRQPARTAPPEDRPTEGWSLPVIASLVILIFVSVAGHYLEHYLLPFFPFAVLCVSSELGRMGWAPRAERFFRGLIGVGIIPLFFLQISHPEWLRADRSSSLRAAAAQLQRECRADELWFDQTQEEKWLGLAALLWQLPWPVTPTDPQGLQPAPKRVYLTKHTGQIAPVAEWEAVPLSLPEPYRAFEPRGSGLCRP